jgi:hypothetical protein
MIFSNLRKKYNAFSKLTRYGHDEVHDSQYIAIFILMELVNTVEAVLEWTAMKAVLYSR